MFGDLSYKIRIFLFFCATIMSVLPTISIQVQKLSMLDIFRVKFNTTAANDVNEVRFGVWSFCLHRSSLEGDVCNNFSPCNLTESLRLCSEQKYGYDLKITENGENPISKTVTPARTRALASHAAASVMMVVCFILLCIGRTRPEVYFVAILVDVITFLCDIAVTYHVQSVVGGLGNMVIKQQYLSSPGFALQLLSSLWLMVDCFWDSNDVDDDFTIPSIPTTVLYPSRPVEQGRNINSAEELEKMRLSLFSVSRSPSPVRQTLGVERPIVHRKSTDSLPGKECPICMERKTNLSELSCRHVFCTECLDKSVGMYARCPICNRSARKPEVRRVSMSSFV